MSKPSSIQSNIDQLRQQIRALESKYKRQTAVRLIGVSKTKSSNQIETAVRAGLSDIAENYLQEALKKQAELSHLQPVWHFIGPIQSNKAAKIAVNFSWVHSVTSIKIAERLSRQRPGHLDPLQVLIQVNISDEATKSGVSPSSVTELALAIQTLPNLQLRGLMAVPAHTDSLTLQREPFQAMRQLLEKVRTDINAASMDQLSMGMSQDMEAAIAEGATMVRIGTAIFGSRPKSPGHNAEFTPSGRT